MFIEIHAVTITTHECRHTGQQIEDQRHVSTYRIDLAQFAALLQPFAEFFARPPAEKTNGRNGNGACRIVSRE